MKTIRIKNQEFLFLSVRENAYDFEMRRNDQVVYSVRGVINPLTGGEKSEIIKLEGTRYGLVSRDWEVVGKASDIDPELIVEKVNEGTKYEAWYNYWLHSDIEAPPNISIAMAAGNRKYTSWLETAKDSLQTILDGLEMKVETTLILKKI